ncbi:MAG: hypothetical protein M1128_01820 [Candidatus Marsarchaeota archaeon]|nr:hypothetical protein [Candidatus Marsarchaeota archaeon]
MSIYDHISMNGISSTRYLVLPFILFMLLAFQANASSANSTIAINQSMNFSHALNSTLGYLKLVNQSSYVVFYPNMKYSAILVQNAKNASIKNPGMAYRLLNEARVNATEQLNAINKYEDISFLVMVALAIITGLLLMSIMKKYDLKSRKH